MIDSINGVNYNNPFAVLNGQVSAQKSETQIEQISFDIQAILSQVSEYTYTQKDAEEVDDQLVKSIKDKFNIKEEDVYELYKRGVDLENLNLQEVSYKNNAKTYNLEEENTKLDDESLEEKINVIKQENDSMYLAAANSQGIITINSLYESSFKGDFKKGNNQYTDNDISNVLNLNGLAETSGNKWAANMLMMYDMGVSPQSISRLQNIKSAVAALDTQDAISGDEALLENDQVQYKQEYVDRITDDLGMVTDEHIEKLIEEGKEINIDELRESIHKNVDEALHSSKIPSATGPLSGEHGTGEYSSGQEDSERGFGEDASQMQQSVDEVKRQILQITTKLTVEAAQKISAKMPLESSSLVEVASALSQMEQEMATAALEQVNLPITEENIAKVTDVMNVVSDMSSQFIPTVQIEVATDENATLSEIQTALTAYSENETPVETRFGESIKTVEVQITSLLQSQGIEATSTNIEAAKALITNNIEVSAENIQSIQDIVLKLNTFLEEMTPIQAATMIKEGLDPYNASVNQILSWMSQSKTEGLKTSVAEAIVSLESSGQINDEQKEGMIGLYRILQAVSNQKEEVMGYLYKNELPITVQNLQIAAKYVKGKNRIEATIDDEFGELESAVSERKTAKQLLENSMEQSNKTLEAIRVLENMELPITEENIDKISKMSALLYPYIKEQFKKNLGKFDGMSSLPESFLDKIQTVQNVSSEVVESMISQNIPLTLSNIYWMDKINSDPEIYGELLNDKGLLKEGLPKDLEEVEDTLQEIEAQAKEQKEEATLTGDLAEYRNYKQLEEVVRFQRERIENEGLYQIPFIIDGERRLINLYVEKDESSTIADESHLKAMISYNTKTMGTVKAYIELKGENIGYKIEGENAADNEALKAHSQTLIEGLKSIGYNVQHSEYIEESTSTEQAAAKKQKHSDSIFEEIV